MAHMKNNQLPFSDSKNAKEVLRVWLANAKEENNKLVDGKLEVIARIDAFEDVAMWGIVLADIARHVTDAVVKKNLRPGHSEECTLNRIAEFFIKELQRPTAKRNGTFISDAS